MDSAERGRPDLSNEKVRDFLMENGKVMSGIDHFFTEEGKKERTRKNLDFVKTAIVAKEFLFATGMKKEDFPKDMGVVEMLRMANERYKEVTENQQVEQSEDVVVLEEKVAEPKMTRKEWGESVGADLILAVKPIHKFTDNTKLIKRPPSDIAQDIKVQAEARDRLGDAYKVGINGLRNGKTPEERKNLNISIEDASLLVSGKRTKVRSGMTLEQANELLKSLGVSLPVEEAPVVEKNKPEQIDVEKTEKRDIILSMLESHISNEVVQKLTTEVNTLSDAELSALHATVIMLNDPQLREVHKSYWNEYSKPILEVLGVSVV